jgi:large subunit ribosomal protein L33
MAKGSRIFIRLKCSECGSINYTFKKSKINTKEALELRKFCSKERKYTLHKETKI